MSGTSNSLCICSKPAQNRCSACKSVGYCSQECQRRDWKTHKIQCKIASQQTARTPTARAQVGSASQLSELLRVGGQHTIYQESAMLGLDPLLITGANGEDFYLTKVDGARNFWRLEAPIREQWEAKAQVHNRKAQRFWTSYLSPISIGQEWVDVVLDAVLNVRLMWQDQVNANIIAGLFPHLRRFTPAQNTTLLDLFASRVWNSGDEFRLQTGTNILFGHGQPTPDLIDQLIGRCLSWTRPYSEIEQLIGPRSRAHGPWRQDTRDRGDFPRCLQTPPARRYDDVQKKYDQPPRLQRTQPVRVLRHRAPRAGFGRAALAHGRVHRGRSKYHALAETSCGRECREARTLWARDSGIFVG
ncbi:hypothetical protein C8R47DRAFT_811362 [Mycena vitilis]|nr:hypothetical protein C8R47DRAFT_811362 [Mycena vitilis]